MNDFDPDTMKRRRINAGFTVGLVGMAIMIAVYLLLLLIFQGTTRGDWLGQFIQLFLYFFVSQIAAQQHYNSQERSPEALRGVRAAGVGAALVVSLSIWLFIIIRDLILDALGLPMFVEPLSTFCIVVVDVLLAIGLGSWGGMVVEKKYKGFEQYH